MKERPILFNSKMVRAILDGIKTQTRRVVKPCKDKNMGISLALFELAGEINQGDYTNSLYGQVGDRLWVRETWQYAGGNTGIWYAATDLKADDGNSPVSHWKPSIHMPRKASRITLEITGLRMERLQDISESDAVAEGVFTDPACPAYEGYRSLWESINGAGSWAVNPWVWVIDFKRLEDCAA